MALDYRPGYSRFLEGLSEPFVMAADRREREKRAAEYKRQNDLVQRRQDMIDLRDRQKFELDQSDRKRKLMGEIGDLAREGRLGEAEALSASAQYVDPRTGKVASLKFDRGGERLAPEQLEPAPQLELPSENPPAARMDEMRLKLDPTIAAMKPKAQLPTRTVNPSITTPNGERVEFDPNEANAFKQQQGSDRAQRYRLMAEREADPAMRMSWLRAADREDAGMSNGEQAHLRGREGQEDSQAFQSEQGDLNRQSRVDVAKMRRRPGGSGAGAGTSVKAQKAEADLTKKNLDVEQEYMEAAEKTLGKVGAVDVFKQERKLQDMATQVAGADNNAALAAMVAGTFTKYAQGGTGVVSDQDMRVFWQRMGGVGVRTMQAIEDIMSGRLAPEKKKIVEQAVTELIGASKKHENEIGQRLETNVGNLPGGRERLPRILGTYTPTYLKEWQAKQAAGGDKASLDSLEAEIDARMQKRAK